MKSRNLVDSFRAAFAGLWHLLQTQPNARIHLLAAVVVLLAALLLRLSLGEIALICVVIALVFVSELFNTAIEALVDLNIPEYHPLAKVAKDVSAGAVLVTAVMATLVGIIIFGSNIQRLLTTP
ncbi:MAG: diacylglycerol kinase family protein [Chloroflexi bacterium]|nr:diacylglycerol kinase family protein [Chloroflexota bacterium]MCL5074765.1 diacylglycerol kinase family protein [Chloroflexota bacterium]